MISVGRGLSLVRIAWAMNAKPTTAASDVVPRVHTEQAEVSDDRGLGVRLRWRGIARKLSSTGNAAPGKNA